MQDQKSISSRVERTHWYAAIVNDGRSRVFIQIDDVLIKIFHDKFFSIRWHPCMNETVAWWDRHWKEIKDEHNHTHDARLSSGLPSSALSSCRSWYAAFDGIPTLGMVYLGTSAASSSRLQDWCTIRLEPWLECFLWMWSLDWSMTVWASTKIKVIC